MKHYQYILLDWDGNLAKTLHTWLDACRIVTQRRDIAVTDAEIEASYGSFTRHLKTWGVADPEVAMAEIITVAAQLVPEAGLYPDVLEVLRTMRRHGKKLALVSNSPHADIDNLLKKHGLDAYFDVVIATDDVTKRKPDAEPLHKALVALGGTNEGAVMIGDSGKDIMAAHKAGMDSILFYPPEHKTFYDFNTLEALKPTYIFDDFRDILKVI